MSLLTEWREHAYSLDDRTPEGKEFWLDYFQREKAIYEKILENPVEIEGGTVKELAEKYDMSIELMIGFLDGIEDSLIVPNKVDELEEDSQVALGYVWMLHCKLYRTIGTCMDSKNIIVFFLFTDWI